MPSPAECLDHRQGIRVELGGEGHVPVRCLDEEVGKPLRPPAVIVTRQSPVLLWKAESDDAPDGVPILLLQSHRLQGGVGAQDDALGGVAEGVIEIGIERGQGNPKGITWTLKTGTTTQDH